MSFDETLSMISLLLSQAGFEDLLACLPDEFFDLDEMVRMQAWRGILSLANRGEREPQKLADQIMAQMAAQAGITSS